MIRESVVVVNLVLFFLVSFSVCKDKIENNFPAQNGDAENILGNPLLQMLSEIMMNKDSNSPKSSSLRELQRKVESDRSNIQRIPKKNELEKEKLALGEKKRKLEEQQRELEDNLVISPDYDKYAYKSKQPAISVGVVVRCELATCMKDGKPFMNIHNYCNNGIHDLQSACEQKYFSVRHRREFVGKEIVQVQQLPQIIGGCIVGTTWKDECNTCLCVTEGIPACTRMSCPPKSPAMEVQQPSANLLKKSRRDIQGIIARALSAAVDDDEQNDQPDQQLKQPDSIDHKCAPNSTWEEDCNTCYCTQDGLGKFCTTEMCMDENAQAVTAPLPCMPGTSWTQDCNECYCTNVGAPSCSLISC